MKVHLVTISFNCANKRPCQFQRHTTLKATCSFDWEIGEIVRAANVFKLKDGFMCTSKKSFSLLLTNAVKWTTWTRPIRGWVIILQSTNKASPNERCVGEKQRKFLEQRITNFSWNCPPFWNECQIPHYLQNLYLEFCHNMVYGGIGNGDGGWRYCMGFGVWGLMWMIGKLVFKVLI